MYPNAQISVVDDYSNRPTPIRSQLVAELRLIHNDALPIKEYGDFKVDPLSSLTAVLSELNASEQAWVQIVITPALDEWHKDSEKYEETLKIPKPPSIFQTIVSSNKARGSDDKVDDDALLQAKVVNTKNTRVGFITTIRVVYRGDTKFIQAKIRLQAITSSFKQFDNQYGNRFEQIYLGEKNTLLSDYHQRSFALYNGILTPDEIAAIYHFPNSDIETSGILWASSKRIEPSVSLPLWTNDLTESEENEISVIGTTSFRGEKVKFGLPRSDRNRHLYILGQTGVGKSALLELLSIADLNSPYGFAIIDPHGDYAVNILKRIPKKRVDEVIYFNPADIDFPVAFNPLEIIDPNQKNQIVNETVEVLRPFFDSWNTKLELLIRNVLIALVNYPDSTMCDISTFIEDEIFRKKVISNQSDPSLKRFWLEEFADWQKKYAHTTITPLLTKIGGFANNPIIKNIIGTSKSSFDIRSIMDERKILIINLSRGLVGEEDSALLGSLFISCIKRAAMSRAVIEDLDQRTPFYLYVDEFQHFAHDSFKTILSEARKYGLILTVANQYVEQMSKSVRDAIFGNVGSMISFRLSSGDAKIMAKYFEPSFMDHDLLQLHNRDVAIAITIDGQKIPAFSATTIDLPSVSDNNALEVINQSRSKYARNAVGIDSTYLLTKANSRNVLKHKSQNDMIKDLGGFIRQKAVDPSVARVQDPRLLPIPKFRQLAKRKKTKLKETADKTIDLDEDKTIKLH